MKKYIVSAILLISVNQPYAAQDSLTARTLAVKGHPPELTSKPEIFNYTRRGSAPIVGDDLRHYLISTKDKDGDIVTAKVQWLRDGVPIPGQTSLTYFATSEDVGKDITVKYILTTPAASTDPNESIYISKSLGKVQKKDNSEHYPPDPIFRLDIGLKSSTEAIAACTDANGQVATYAQAKNLYIQSTSAISVNENNEEMCTLWEWPLNNQCGGASDYYWAKDGSTYKSFSLRTGTNNTSNTSAYVMCSTEG
ncbi:hypothetical protein WG219_21280 [Ectopseudomonas mendocina]|uniref:Ig-like domain-containing protein n=1 Tax=Ectopseudomonas mendocina TaxID=300 RepID=A0ABZ2RGT4_ECTME